MSKLRGGMRSTSFHRVVVYYAVFEGAAERLWRTLCSVTWCLVHWCFWGRQCLFLLHYDTSRDVYTVKSSNTGMPLTWVTTEILRKGADRGRMPLQHVNPRVFWMQRIWKESLAYYSRPAVHSSKSVLSTASLGFFSFVLRFMLNLLKILIIHPTHLTVLLRLVTAPLTINLALI